MDHVEFPQYVAIMLELELALVGSHKDADGDRRSGRVRMMDTLRDTVVQSVD